MAEIIEFPVIDMEATGNNIRQLRVERGLTVREVQEFFGFEEPGAIYQWQRGKSLPTVDNLCALSKLFEVQIEDILVLRKLDNANEERKLAMEVKKNRHINKMFFLWVA